MGIKIAETPAPTPSGLIKMRDLPPVAMVIIADPQSRQLGERVLRYPYSAISLDSDARWEVPGRCGILCRPCPLDTVWTLTATEG